MSGTRPVGEAGTTQAATPESYRSAGAWEPLPSGHLRAGRHPDARSRRLGTFAALVGLFSLFGLLVRLWFLARGGQNQQIGFSPVFVWCLILGLFRDSLVSMGLAWPLLFALIPRRAGAWWYWLAGVVVFLQTIILLVLLVDVEFMRFYLVHMNAYVFTYLNELGTLSGSMGDLLAPWEWLVGFGLIPLSFVASQVAAVRRPPALRLDMRRIPSWWIPAAVALGITIGATNYKMTRWFTRDLLAYNLSDNAIFVMIETAMNPKYMAPPVPSAERFVQARNLLREFLGSQPLDGDSEQPWYYLSDEYAWVRGTGQHACALGLADRLALDCSRDGDGDGFELRQDCDDTRFAVHPGATDRPLDRDDEDCDGIDSARPNVILVLMESYRGVNVGSFRPYGAFPEAATPALDSLARQGLLFHHFYASGVTTARAVLAVMCGTYPHVGAMLLRDYNYLDLLAVGQVLRRHGYVSAYLHAGDTRFDNKRRWLAMWFDEIHDSTNTYAAADGVTSWGVDDRVMFEHALRWADDRHGTPFFLTVVPVINHHPFHTPPGYDPPFPRAEDIYHRFLNTMTYSDHVLGEFIEAARGHPWFERTYFLVTSDTGQVMGERGVTNDLGAVGPYQPSMWVPLFILGPNLPDDPTRREALTHQVGSQVDLAVTILDLLGIWTPHPFAGRSLLASVPYERSLALVSNPYREVWVALREGDDKTIHARETGMTQRYDLADDPLEQHDLVASSPMDVSREIDLLQAWVDLQEYLVFHNLFWDAQRFELGLR